LEDGGGEAQPEGCRWPLQVRKGKEADFPLEPPERHMVSEDTLVLARRDPCWTLDLIYIALSHKANDNIS
jgi:hypothetical protein